MAGSSLPHPSSAEWFDRCTVAELRKRRGAKWQKFGPDVLAAWVADMDFPPAPPVQAALDELVRGGDFGYPWLDPDPVAAAFADWSARRYGMPLDPARIVPTIDVLQPLQAAIVAHSEPGDGVVIQTPIYPPFLKVLAMTGRELVDHPLGAPEDGYPLDVDGLERVIDARTRILLLCNPHNPSGRVFTRTELEALAAVAEAHGLLVISDEIHADLVYGDARHIPFASVSPAAAARSITLTSATKSFNIAGLRLAVAVFGSAELQERYASIGRFLLGGMNTPGVAATVAAWREGDEWLDALRAYLDANRSLVTSFVAEHLPGVSAVAPEATYLAWLDSRELVASGRTDDPAGFFLRQAGVALNDGREFGVHGDGFVRLNFATSRSVLLEVLERMAAALR